MIQLTASKQGRLTLALGTVSTADETYLNGVLLGTSGSFDKESAAPCGDALRFRQYTVLSHMLNMHEENLLAVRVYSGGDGSLSGGLVDNGASDERRGPFDAGMCLASTHVYCFTSLLGLLFSVPGRQGSHLGVRIVPVP